MLRDIGEEGREGGKLGDVEGLAGRVKYEAQREGQGQEGIPGHTAPKGDEQMERKCRNRRLWFPRPDEMLCLSFH